jgi:methionyl-tRNA synthetase
MPKTAKKIAEQLGLKDNISRVNPGSLKEWGGLRPGLKISQGEALFPRIDEKKEKAILDRVKSAQESGNGEVENVATIEDFMKIDLRSGLVIEAERIKKSKKLLKLKVDIGKETRQVCAGIAENYDPEELIGRKVVLVANLKPVKLMGIESQGMVLAASEGNKVVLAGFDEDVMPGWKVK